MSAVTHHLLTAGVPLIVPPPPPPRSIRLPGRYDSRRALSGWLCIIDWVITAICLLIASHCLDDTSALERWGKMEGGWRRKRRENERGGNKKEWWQDNFTPSWLLVFRDRLFKVWQEIQRRAERRPAAGWGRSGRFSPSVYLCFYLFVRRYRCRGMMMSPPPSGLCQFRADGCVSESSEFVFFNEFWSHCVNIFLVVELNNSCLFVFFSVGHVQTFLTSLLCLKMLL